MEDLIQVTKKFMEESLSPESKKAFEQLIPNGAVRSSFIRGTVRAFFQQDLLTATWQFFRRAHGTFGCSVSCSVFTNTCILAAKGQPVSIGFDSGRALALWTSEPASLAARWPGSTSTRPAATSRWDIRDVSADIDLALPVFFSLPLQAVGGTLAAVACWA
jgi:hypothetical protein